MRIAVISDVHGNLLALEAVLADIRYREVDLTINLGDLLSGGLQPAATAERLMELDAVTVRGNHDRQLLGDPAAMGRSDLFAHSEITAEQRAWVSSLPPIAAPAAGVLAFHGTPTDDKSYLLDTVTADGARPANKDEVADRLGDFMTVPLLLCGHSHLQRSMRLSSGAFAVNPGSVGMPAYSEELPFPHTMAAGTPHARYAIADDSDGKWRVRFHAIDYEWTAAAMLAERNGRTDLASALLTGTV